MSSHKRRKPRRKPRRINDQQLQAAHHLELIAAGIRGGDRVLTSFSRSDTVGIDGYTFDLSLRGTQRFNRSKHK